MVLRAEQGDGRAGLGQPVRVDEIDPGPLPQRAFDERGRHGGAAVGERPQGRHRPVFRAVDDPRQHGRHHHRAGDLFLPYRAEPFPRGEGFQHEGAAARVEVGDHVGDGGDVVRRHAHQRRLCVAGRRELHRAQHVGDQVLVAQQHALGLGRGPAGVDDDGDRVLVGGGRFADLAAVGARLLPATRRRSSRQGRPARSAPARRGRRSPAPSGAAPAARRAAAAPAGS